MFGKRDVATDGGRRRREGRGIGPFTSGHLTAIVITVVVVVGFPFAAGAVTGSNTFITDFTSGAHAGVDAKQDLNTAIHDPVSGKAASVNFASGGQGWLQTGANVIGRNGVGPDVDTGTNAKTAMRTDLADPSTGSGAKVDASGNLQTKVNGGTVGVTGSVTASPTTPSSMFSAIGGAAAGDDACDFFTPKPGFAAVITSIDVYTKGATPAEPVSDTLSASTVTDCTAGTIIIQDSFGSDSPHAVPLGVGIGIAAGHHLALRYFGPLDAESVVMTVFGYYVPAAQCASGCL